LTGLFPELLPAPGLKGIFDIIGTSFYKQDTLLLASLHCWNTGRNARQRCQRGKSFSGPYPFLTYQFPGRRDTASNYTCCKCWYQYLNFSLWWLPSVLSHCWLGARKSIWPVKIEWWGVGLVICLEWSADCLHMVHLMPLHPKPPSSHASFKSRLGLPFCYWLTQVVLEKRLLNRCSSRSIMSAYLHAWWRHYPTGLSLTSSKCCCYTVICVTLCAQLDGLEKSFYSFYICTAVRKFFFFLDPLRTGRVRIQDILACSFLDDLLEVCCVHRNFAYYLWNTFSMI